MIWTPATEDKNALLYMDEGRMLGTVRKMENRPDTIVFVAATNSTYLGQYKKQENAMKAVEEKIKAELKKAH